MILKRSIGLILFCLFLPFLSSAQNEAKFLVVTRVHIKPSSGSTYDQWKANEMEFFEKVTKKNDLVVGSNVLVHYYTNDNSEILFATAFRTWDDIEKADAKDNELIKAAWPDETARKAFMKKRTSFYTSEHSDEIYSILPNTKHLEPNAQQQIYYVRSSRLAFPDDSKTGEMAELANEYTTFVTLKNPLLKGYYPARHLWGADGREIRETFVFASLADLEKSATENEKLEKAHWPDETKRKEFFAKFDRYYEPWHGDQIFRHIPELRKVMVAAK
jgi:hypothetical protein